MDTFSKMMIILFNFTVILGFVASVGAMKELNLFVGLIMMITIVCLALIFNYYEVIKHKRFD